MEWNNNNLGEPVCSQQKSTTLREGVKRTLDNMIWESQYYFLVYEKGISSQQLAEKAVRNANFIFDLLTFVFLRLTD